MRRLPSTLSTCLASILAIGIAACATASGDEQIVDPPTPDAEVSVPADARKPIVDASPIEIPDATIVIPVDAAVIVPDAEIGGLFCDGNTDCASQDCCFLSLCIRGTRLGSSCLPD